LSGKEFQEDGRAKGAPAFVEGGGDACAIAQWHNGQSESEAGIGWW